MEEIETSRDHNEGNGILHCASKKQSIQHCYFCTAIFNVDLETIIKILTPICKKFITGKEICPTTNKIHYQTFISLKKKMRATELNKLIKSQWINCTGTEEQNVAYCSKDKDVYKYGFPKEIKIITELRPWQQKVFDIYETEPNDRHIHWFWEYEGNVGKSKFTKYMVVKHNCLFCDGGKKSDLINLVFNNDMDNCKCIIWDLPRATGNKISYTTIESVKNGLICNTKFETGNKTFNDVHIFIFANFPPDIGENLSADKWKIYNINDM